MKKIQKIDSYSKNMKNNSRRLKHFRQSNSFFVKTQQKILGLEAKITKEINNFVVLEKKYILKGHSKENDIKKIENTISTEIYKDGYLVKLSLHIHHYSKFCFDLNNFLYRLGDVLELEAGTIIQDTQKPQDTQKTQKPQELSLDKPVKILSNSFI